LSSLICFHTEKFIRKKFIEACLSNIANNRSVIISLKLIPKILASFQQFRDVGTHQVTMWAEKQHKMMNHFFNNLKCYCNQVRQEKAGIKNNQDQPQITLVTNQNGDLFYSHTMQIQVRLQFLASIFCDIGSPKTFRLTINQIDILWSCIANDPECADCLFHWLHNQAKSNNQHALSAQALQHIYLKKWPELRPENMSMVALTLFQQLFILGLSDEMRSEKSDSIGMDNLWKIALRANDTEVSMAAIQYINTYYMENQLKNEKEFVAQCMNYLSQAAEGLNKPQIEEQSIMCVQRALMLLNTHLETFRRRYAYHLRRWTLEGKGIISHSHLRSEGPGLPIKIILQPGGLPEKSYLHLFQTDLVADLKAEIAKWWESLQSSIKNSGGAPVLGTNLLSDGPLRIITQGQEITSEYDERSLIDVGFKDNQMVYVSLGGRSGRRRDHSDHPSMLPAPSRDCLPTILLLQSPYFEQLFKLMQTLGDMTLINRGGSIMQHTQAQVLSRRVWDILAMLPTSPSLLEKFKNFSLAEKSSKSESNVFSIRDILDPSNLQKFMYSLHIVESLCKSKFATTAKNSTLAMNERARLKMKMVKASKAAKKSPAKENNENNVEENNDKKENENSSNARYQSDSDHATMSREESALELKIKKSIEWSNQFIKNGGLEHLYEILMSASLQRQDENYYNEWRYDCLCSLLRILCLLGVDDLKQEENIIVIPKLNENMLKIMDVKKTITRISSILNEAAVPLKDNHYKTGFWGRSQVVNFAMNLLVCFCYSSQEARETLWIDADNYSWLQKLILDDPDPHVRRETCAALYRLCMGNQKSYSELMIPLLVKLISFLPIAEKMKTQTNCYSAIEDGKEPYGQACRDYFWLLSRLVDQTTPDLIKSNLSGIHEDMTIDIEALCLQVSQLVINRDHLESRHIQDDGLVGLLSLMANLCKYDPPFKYSQSGQQFIAKIFECLFALPTPDHRDLPKCKSQGARAASYDLLIELCRNSPSNYMLLHKMLMLQHRPGPHSPYPWDYWPRDDGRSECGYVGLTNLGATCYMASCIQHIFMMPQARETILSVPADAPVKHKQTFTELQKMFAYLMESERKAYNPRPFCKVYQMDHQPLNTGEQKDMAEFFIDLVSKLEEMTSELKSLVKQIFCGVISNNVVSLDCGHVSRTLEEFYTVRCQVADMRNLQESLDEVTVKDTLEGDNMYTCSQCGRKVRAEKRACFKKLPQILCFNTMRYTFNMVTMLKEKVNTHFSFPLRLDMSRYVEKTLMPDHYQEDKMKSQLRRKASESESVKSSSNSDEGCSMKIDDNENIKDQQSIDSDDHDDFDENYEYDLVGVTVHTGTADGGHYYSFIKERDNGRGGPSDRWFLFNDAEVKLFDPSQIAAECFGGEMTVSFNNLRKLQTI
jgi:ubiquitin carboxyl-terminal hydrolase 34